MRRGACAAMLLANFYFNPRTPYGMRQYTAIRIDSKTDFNPRTPYGMRLSVNVISLPVMVISIHAPLTGCD